MGSWQELNHTADLALHVSGVDLADLFATAARGMAALLVDPEAVALSESVTVVLAAPDVETLLVDWLNELLYLGEREETLSVYTTFEFESLTPTALRATVRGGGVERYAGVIKAATFHNLEVRQTPEGYETEIVFDT
ncbi:MAG: archease [Anaerolineae bacterium]|jgi:SHS2 domain-containing protein|nr:archease [Anaerolineae bacterium]